MASSPFYSSSLVLGSSPPSSPPPTSPPKLSAPSLDLSVLPAIFVLPTHMSTDDLHELEERLSEQGAPLTYDVTEAKLVIGKVGTKRRAEMELRCRQLWTEEVVAAVPKSPAVEKRASEGPPRKRQRISQTSSTSKAGEAAVVVEDSETESEAEEDAIAVPGPASRQESLKELTKQLKAADIVLPFTAADFFNSVRVIKLEWLEASTAAGKLLALDSYTVYHGRPIKKPEPTAPPKPEPPALTRTTSGKVPLKRDWQTIVERAQADAAAGTTKHGLSHYAPALHGPRRFHDQTLQTSSTHVTSSISTTQKTHLLQQTTSEYEGTSSDIPPPPAWVQQELKYACQRSTPANPPNAAFIEQLKRIRLARTLTLDEIGVRAYSTSIAALAAYPYALTSPREILALPGCDAKIANLWVEWKNSGGGILEAVRAFEEDPEMQTLRLFYDVWGVGAATAREFYHDRGWRDLDDVVEFGWNTLSRVQQIGVKYYDEFRAGIPRPEVEAIAATVRAHAVKVRDEGAEVLVVGGYRRGKKEAGDVDLIVSHRRLDATANLVTDIVASLEAEGWVTHTLLLSLNNTQRGQATLPFRASHSEGGAAADKRAGFDTLDKALVVWQDPAWPTRDEDRADNPKAKNPNVHRRVDIIVSPWRTVGCAVAGWSGGTTFQRDLRRYAKAVKGWKFDSSGVRDRRTGEVVLLEGSEGVEGGMEDAERKVFEGLGLVYREPWERCTG